MHPIDQYRHPGPELLDNMDIPFADIARNMEELERINRYLGGHAITLAGLKRILPADLGRPALIVEMGSGGGDNLAAIHRWAVQQSIPVQLMGIDLNPNCVEYAKKRYPAFEFLQGSYEELPADLQPDILFSSLFAHHFTADAMIGQLRWMESRAQIGFFINDLHRHWLAATSIKWLTTWFSQSYLVKHDAPLSVQRGWLRTDWETLLESAQIPHASVEWKWAFRWLVTRQKLTKFHAS